jgi:hypothetical protein
MAENGSRDRLEQRLFDRAMLWNALRKPFPILR